MFGGGHIGFVKGKTEGGSIGGGGQLRRRLCRSLGIKVFKCRNVLRCQVSGLGVLKKLDGQCEVEIHHRGCISFLLEEAGPPSGISLQNFHHGGKLALVLSTVQDGCT